MNRFSYERADSLAAAVNSMAGIHGAKFIGGGTNLIDLIKENVEKPAHLIDINRLPLAEIEMTAAGGLRIGALVRNADLAWHPAVETRYPLLSRALLAGASPQLRNKATTGGNLLQRTRCYYFYDTAARCNKREPGSGCDALTGYNRMHAILGSSIACIATHPSDMCVALAALDAVIHVLGPNGARSIDFADFHRLPGDTPHLDSNLAADELIVAVELPPEGYSKNFAYLKLRDRSSYAFALVSVAVGLSIVDGRILSARLALGGVAHKPWRTQSAESLLIDQAPSPALFAAVADRLLEGAQGAGHNDFKIPMAKRAIVRALGLAASAESTR